MRDKLLKLEVITFIEGEWVVVALGLEMGVKLATFRTRQEAESCLNSIDLLLTA